LSLASRYEKENRALFIDIGESIKQDLNKLSL